MNEVDRRWREFATRAFILLLFTCLARITNPRQQILNNSFVLLSGARLAPLHHFQFFSSFPPYEALSKIQIIYHKGTKNFHKEHNTLTVLF